MFERTAVAFKCANVTLVPAAQISEKAFVCESVRVIVKMICDPFAPFAPVIDAALAETEIELVEYAPVPIAPDRTV